MSLPLRQKTLLCLLFRGIHKIRSPKLRKTHKATSQALNDKPAKMANNHCKSQYVSGKCPSK